MFSERISLSILWTETGIFGSGQIPYRGGGFGTGLRPVTCGVPVPSRTLASCAWGTTRAAARLPGEVNADWGPGEDPEACAVEVLFLADDGAGYVVLAVGPSAPAAVAAAEEEARRCLGCGVATDRSVA